MNKRNDWENLLSIANNDLAKHGFSLKVYEPEEEGFYFLDILKDGKEFDNYAGNYYEEELEELVSEAWGYVKSELC